MAGFTDAQYRMLEKLMDDVEWFKDTIPPRGITEVLEAVLREHKGNVKRYEQ